MTYRQCAALLTACLVCAAQQSPFEIARGLQNEGRYAEAETYYRRALKSDPRSVPALTNLGVVLARQGKYLDAIAAYRSALAIDPSEAAPKVNLAIAYFQIGDCKSATQWLKSTLEARPDDRRSFQLLGVCQLELGLFHAATRSFERLMPSDDPSILLGVATAYLKTGRTAEGRRILDQLVREHGDDPGVEVAIGMANFGSEEYNAASSAFRAALKRDPRNAAAHFYLGATLFKQRDFDGAIREWREAVQQKPGYFPAVFALGAMLSERRQYQEAKPLLRKALELRPDHPAIYFELGKIAVHERQHETAVRYLREATRLDPGSKPASFLLATALQRLGRDKEAQNEFARSRKLYQGSEADVVERALDEPQPGADAR
ncbi:MAG TPA: tetratricopeptide repeat protein [Bryobacteraceae bacterium]|jgi:tetratricopeptide (TPR) repeat protein|nr:tetratricopeptide repeat protein [Bryobacteraceae bacterium]